MLGMPLAQLRKPDPGLGEITSKGVLSLKAFEYIFDNLVTVVLSFAGIVLFLMLVAGGFRFITAGGEPKAVQGARNTLTFAIAGLVLIVVSLLILRFIETFTGVNVTIFKIHY